VWTPKRLALMLVIFVGLVSAYGVYGHFLGGIDGLTPLPEDFWPPEGAVEPIMVAAAHSNKAERMLEQAFSKDCDELSRINKLEIPSRHMVLAVDRFEPVHDDPQGKRNGQVLLEPFSVATFGKETAGAYPEINTIKSKQAYLTFDHPISSISEIGKAKIVGAELIGDVEIRNNRRTPDRADDLFIRTEGPVYYDEPKHLIFTDKVVRLEDSQSQPQPHNITAIGMEVYLTPPDSAAATPPDKKKAKSSPDGISGVDRIRLRSVVQMDLYVDSRSGFMATNNGAKPLPTPASPTQQKGTAAPPAKDHVQITTQGPFTYDVPKDLAVFEISFKPSPLPSRVHVIRNHLETGKTDELYCDRLELQFHRKPPPADPSRPGAADERSLDLEIETAHAVQLQEDPVSLVSYAEMFNASCHDLFYDARTKETTLKGNPVVAMKEGNLIRSSELLLIAADEKRPQQARAKGPGQIDMLDKGSGNKTLHARWSDLLTSTKDGVYDCLILTGDAVFEDEENGQKLQSDRIKVWLEPAKPAGPNAPPPEVAKPVADQQSRARPHHLEATGRVHLISPELNLEKNDHFTIWFKDAPETAQPILKPDMAVKPGQASMPADPAKESSSMLTSKSKETGQFQTGATPPGAPTSKPKKPLKLEAREVKAHVLRSASKNDLESLDCQGTVRVKQEPATPEDKGVDIRGDSLQLNHFAEGNILVVTGNPRELAWVQLDKLTIQGKEVNIDQRFNRAWVNDIGVMQMLTTTDFEGNKLPRPTQVTIHWNKEMQFDGKRALFSGGVTGEQNNSRLQCQEMQVDLDRPVSFKEGERNGAPAKVEHLVCDRRLGKEPVMVEDTKFEESKLISYQKLFSQEVHLDNKEGKMEAPGPGILNLLQLGTADDDPLSTPETKKSAPKKPPAAAKEELQLTRVVYAGSLHADNKKRIATFYDDVEVYHGPADDPDIQLDPAHLPVGWMYLRCKILKVYSESLPNGQKNQHMEATGQVRIRASDYWGDAKTVKYDEGKDLIILDGGEDYAHLYRVLAPGAEPEQVEGHKIYYNRKTKAVGIDRGGKIEGRR
jgi:lipopolysaccharide export system protein LptA